MGGFAGSGSHEFTGQNPKKLIEAVVAVVDNDGSPPSELRIDWWCKKWNCLPESGGLFEQDYSLLRRMSVCSNIYGTLSRYRNLHGEEIHSLTEEERKILGTLAKMELL